MKGGPDPATHIAAVTYTLFDPDGTRDASLGDTNFPGDDVIDAIFEFSVDGGGTWHLATPAAGYTPTLSTLREGQVGTFLWNFVQDQAISDDARFRVTVIQQNQQRPFHRGTVSAMSPPFRVRGVSCLWPEDPYLIAPDEVTVGDVVEYVVGRAIGQVDTYFWYFDYGVSDAYTETSSSTMYHRYTEPGVYTLRVVIRGRACPIFKDVFVEQVITVVEDED